MIQVLNVIFVHLKSFLGPSCLQISSRHMPEQQPFIRFIGLSYFKFWSC